MSDSDSYEHCGGGLPCPAGSSGFGIKGELYRNLLLALTYYDGETGGAVWRELEDASVREFCEQEFLRSSLYDAVPIAWIMMAFCRALGRDLRAFTTEIGVRGIKLQMDRGVYGGAFGRMGLHNFHRAFPAAVSGMYDFGLVEISRDLEEGRAQLIRPQVPACLAEWWSLTSIPYVTTRLEADGVTGLTVEHRFEFDSPTRNRLSLGNVIWDIGWDLEPQA